MSWPESRLLHAPHELAQVIEAGIRTRHKDMSLTNRISEMRRISAARTEELLQGLGGAVLQTSEANGSAPLCYRVRG
jgi:hypothetical protein